MKGPLIGTAILLVAYVAWGVAIHAGVVPPWFDRIFLFTPAVAGFVSSWVAPRHQLAPSVILAIPAAIFAALVNLALQMVGDDVGFYSGLLGAVRVAMFTLLSAGLFCAVGGLLAVVVKRSTGKV